MFKLIWKDSLHFDKNAFLTSSYIPLIYYMNIAIFNLNRSSTNQNIISLFYLITIMLYTFFPIKLAKGLYLCPLTEEDRKKYLLTANYLRFGIIMFIYAAVLIVMRILLKTNSIILLLQYLFGGFIFISLGFLFIHPGTGSVESAMQIYYSAQKIPVNIKPKIKKMEKKKAVLSLMLLIIPLVLGITSLLLLGSKNQINPWMLFYYIPSCICSLICIIFFYIKFLDEVLTFSVNRESYHYLKKKAGVFHAD